MKIIYNNTELQHNTKSYKDLVSKPSLNGTILQGNVSLDTLSLYDKPRTKKLVDSVSQIRLVTSMPADPEPSMTYYVGPDERGLYDVILVDDSKTQINMGTTQFGQYKSGAGINIAVDNTININTDDVSVYIDSEGKIASSLDGNALPAFTGATASTAGAKGIVPKPVAGQQNAVLFGNSTGVDLVNYIYPVGIIYLTYSDSTNPNTLFPGTTWAKLDSGYALQTDPSGGLEKLTAGIPNITGTFGIRPGIPGNCNPSGAFYENTDGSQEGAGYSLGGSSNGLGLNTYKFCASSSNSIYGTRTNDTAKGKSNTVQPPAVKIVAWRRTA